MTRIPSSVADEQSRSQQTRLEMSTAEIGLSVGQWEHSIFVAGRDAEAIGGPKRSGR